LSRLPEVSGNWDKWPVLHKFTVSTTWQYVQVTGVYQMYVPGMGTRLCM